LSEAQLSRLFADEAGRDAPRRMGCVLSALVLGHHHAGVARARTRSLSSGRIDSPGNSFQCTRGFAGAGQCLEAGAVSNGNADGQKNGGRWPDNHGMAFRTGLEFSLWNGLSAGPI